MLRIKSIKYKYVEFTSNLTISYYSLNSFAKFLRYSADSVGITEQT